LKPAYKTSQNPDAGRCRCIVLIGFMGAGKSTVGRILANALDWSLIDLDDTIEHASGMSVEKIFADRGEAHFRQVESRELKAALHSAQPSVVAVGGGAIEMEPNRTLLQSATHGRTFYLEAPLAELLSRCAQQSHHRPLLAEAERLFAHRAGLYAAVGSPVSTFGFSAEQVAEHILSLLQMDNALAL
jgi:shikimate kinase